MKYLRNLFFLFIFYPLLALADNGTDNNAGSPDIATVAKQLNLYGGERASIQWKRIFSSKRHLKRYKLDKLPIYERLQLKKYLIEHAADSEQPIIPGL